MTTLRCPPPERIMKLKQYRLRSSCPIYQLDNPEALFNDAIENRSWIEEALKSYGTTYMIIGYQTVHDVHNESDAKKRIVFSSPSQEAAASAAADEVIDQAEEQVQQLGISLGEQVVTVRYRRIRFQFFNNSKLGPKNLECKSR